MLQYGLPASVPQQHNRFDLPAGWVGGWGWWAVGVWVWGVGVGGRGGSVVGWQVSPLREQINLAD